MKRRMMLALLVVLVIGFALPLMGAAAECNEVPNGPDEGNPHAGFGKYCAGVAYCVDVKGPTYCSGGGKIVYRPYWCLGNESNGYTCHGV